MRMVKNIMIKYTIGLIINGFNFMLAILGLIIPETIIAGLLFALLFWIDNGPIGQPRIGEDSLL